MSFIAINEHLLAAVRRDLTSALCEGGVHSSPEPILKLKIE